MRNRLPRAESLKSIKLMGHLFNSGTSFHSYPFRVYIMENVNDADVPVKFLISVSKKNIKTAVKRNRIKRLFRESYRTQKHELITKMIQRKKQLLIAFVYIEREDISLVQMKNRTKTALDFALKKIDSL
jgi:ribonuclease P protein component